MVFLLLLALIVSASSSASTTSLSILREVTKHWQMQSGCPYSCDLLFFLGRGIVLCTGIYVHYDDILILIIDKYFLGNEDTSPYIDDDSETPRLLLDKTLERTLEQDMEKRLDVVIRIPGVIGQCCAVAIMASRQSGSVAFRIFGGIGRALILDMRHGLPSQIDESDVRSFYPKFSPPFVAPTIGEGSGRVSAVAF